jgi:hypothetical protein
MKLTRLVAIAVFLGSVSAGALSAQTRAGSEPAEFPPSSYMGKQYVDSTGCVFIRAGIDGTVSWIPRISRSRQGVCGFRPTFAGAVTPPEPVQTATTTQITNPAATMPAAARPAPRAARAAPAPQPAPRVVRQVAQVPVMKVETVIQPPAPVVQAPRVQVQGTAACPGMSALSSQYMRSGSMPVRCGPQTLAIAGTRISTAAVPRGAESLRSRQIAVSAAPVQVSAHRRIVPRHVAVNRINTTNVQVPHGYKKVWEDDRLNPYRAEQSLAGHQAMGLIWTSTVPRRLINQADGMDVTASVALVYPYTDFVRQQRELGQVTIVQRNGQTLKRIVRGATSIVAPEPRQARVATVQRRPVYSSRSVPAAAPLPTATRQQPRGEVAARGFVQVGQFSDAAAAQRLAQQVQRMGLPVRVGLHTSNGRTTRQVIAGPFSGERAVDSAVSRLRSAGHSAFKR